MRVVWDTIVIVSRFITPAGSAADIFRRWRRNDFELIASEAIIAEYRRVLAYRHIRAMHGLTDQEMDVIGQEFWALASVVTPAPLTSIVIADDPKDDMFLACARAGAADLIVSGDRHLLRLEAFEGIPIVTPAAFLARLVAADTADQ